jgi:hypothetical protein
MFLRVIEFCVWTKKSIAYLFDMLEVRIITNGELKQNGKKTIMAYLKVFIWLLLRGLRETMKSPSGYKPHD